MTSMRDPPLCQVTLGHGGRGITLKAWVSGPEKGDHATRAPGTERTPGDPAPGWAPCRGPAVSNDQSLCRALIWMTLCRKVTSIESRCSRGAGLSAQITGTVAGPWDEPWTRLDCDGEPGPASSDMWPRAPAPAEMTHGSRRGSSGWFPVSFPRANERLVVESMAQERARRMGCWESRDHRLPCLCVGSPAGRLRGSGGSSSECEQSRP